MFSLSEEDPSLYSGLVRQGAQCDGCESISSIKVATRADGGHIPRPSPRVLCSWEIRMKRDKTRRLS